MSTMNLHDLRRPRHKRVLTHEQTARAAALLCGLLRREMTLPQVLDALPGQLAMGAAQ